MQLPAHWYRFLWAVRSVMSAVIASSVSVAAFAGPPERPPNIVFILADDLGYGDLGCYGQQHIHTPNLDRMAAEGMRFTRHYAGNAVCAPSRCVLMTGLHPGQAVVRNNAGGAKNFVSGQPDSEGQFPLPDEALTIPELLGSAGYTCGGFGKWGLGGPDSSGAPLRQGFHRWFGYNCQVIAHNFYPTYLWDNERTLSLPNPAFSAHDTLGDGEDPADPQSYRRFQGDAYAPDLIAEQALRFIAANREHPFFLYWPTTVPHVALQVPDDALEQYDGAFNDPPYTGGRGYIPHFRPRAAYAAMITRMDSEIGRAMDLVAELGLTDHTMFIFTSDNGPLHGTHEGLAGTDSKFFNSHGGLRDGKGTLYEGGVRVPCIVRWPGRIAAGTLSNRICGFEDWMPTLIELAGAAERAPAEADGISLVATLFGEVQPEREFLYREFAGYGGQQSVHAANWKAIRRNLNPRLRNRSEPMQIRTELYDLATDPAETTDLAEQNRDVVNRLEAVMQREHRPSAAFPMALLDRPTAP